MIEVGKRYRKGSIVGTVTEIKKCPCSHECACVVAFKLVHRNMDPEICFETTYHFSGDEVIGFELVRDD